MGMDYIYAGSASYPRFNKELTAVVALFGGVLTEQIKQAQDKVPEGSLDWWFGKPLTDSDAKFSFRSDVPDVFKKWANEPYDSLTMEETKEVHAILATKRAEVEEVSNQIMSEFDYLVNFGECWSIG